MEPGEKVSKRAVVAGAVAAGIGLSFGAGMAVGSDEPDTPGRPLAADRPGSGRVILANADVTITESCDDLLSHYVERGVERVTPWGWGYGDVYYATEGDAESSVGGAARDSATPPPVPQTTRAGGSDTGTNVQEEGVDEPDVVKTDGELLAPVKDDVLTAYTLTGEDPVLVDTLNAARRHDAEILLVGDDVVVIGRDTEHVRRRPASSPGQRSHPPVVVARRPGRDGGHVELALRRLARHRAPARRSVVRLVVTSGLPDLDFVEPGFWRDEDPRWSATREIVEGSSRRLASHAVHRRRDPEPLLECGDVAMPDDEAGLGTMTVVGFDPAFPDTGTPRR